MGQSQTRTSGAVQAESSSEDESSEDESSNVSSTPKSPMHLLKFAYLSVFIDYFGATIMIPILPYFVRQLGASNQAFGMSLALHALATAMSNVFAGAASDATGRRPILLASLLGSAVGFLLTGLTGNIALAFHADPTTVLYITRFVAGLAGNSQPVAQAMIADCTSEEERPKFMGYLGASVGISFAIGPGIGAGILALVNAALSKHGDPGRVFTYVLFFSAGLSLIAFLLAARFLPETRGTCTSEKVEDTPKNDASTTNFLTLNSPLMPLIFVPFMDMASFNGMQSTMGFVVQDIYVAKAKEASKALGLILFGSSIITIPVQSFGFKKIVAKMGLTSTAVAGAVLLGTGSIVMGICVDMKVPLGFLLVPLYMLLVLGFSIGLPPLAVLAARYAPEGKRGTAQGMLTASQTLSRVLVPAPASVLYDRSPGFPYIVFGACSLLAVLPLILASTRDVKEASGA